jgi:hypothetical protein
MSPGRVVLIVAGSLVALIGLVIAAGGGLGIAVHGTERDADGYFTTDPERLETSRYALISDEIDLGADTPGPVDASDLADLRLRVEDAASAAPVFVGIGAREEVARYLAGVAVDRVEDVDLDPFRVEYRPIPGTRAPSPPAGQGFWEVSQDGPGAQTLDWDLDEGTWTLVIMNADGSPGIATDVQAGLKVGWLLWTAIGALVVGLLILAGGIVMIVMGARGRAVPPGPPGPAAI